MIPPPFSRIYDLADLSDAGDEVVIMPDAEQRARLAEWAGVDAVDSFEARVTLRRCAASRFDYAAALAADIVQSCVVSLQPVRSHLKLDVSRALHLSKFPASAKIAPHELAPASDENPEEIENSHYDLVAPLLEEFALAIDPYPRAPGVVFEAPSDGDATENPFAVLKGLMGPR
ncbi:MAG TPA: hypothetical protein VLC74_09790 [Rhizomicrobium sp.]|nr:hypothetical protein [Rhizomicrobium sp.]